MEQNNREAARRVFISPTAAEVISPPSNGYRSYGTIKA